MGFELPTDPDWRNKVEPEVYAKAASDCTHDTYAPCDDCLAFAERMALPPGKHPFDNYLKALGLILGVEKAEAYLGIRRT